MTPIARKILLSGICVITAVLAATPSAAFAAPSRLAGPAVAAAPAGHRLLASYTVPFKPVTARKGSAVTPDSYPPFPSSCELTVLIWDANHEVTAENSVYCSYSVTTIESDLNIQRSRWYGWQTMASIAHENHNSNRLDFSIGYDCAGTGTHTFRSVGNSSIMHNGTWYQASHTDSIPNLSC
jgi:hypothetical protein